MLSRVFLQVDDVYFPNFVQEIAFWSDFATKGSVPSSKGLIFFFHGFFADRIGSSGRFVRPPKKT